MTDVEEDLKPGAVLAAERDSRGWSVEYISDQINLNKKVIFALEDDDYDVLPPAAFVRGYIRSYAKLLEIESDSLVVMYEDLEAAATDVVPAVEYEGSVKSDTVIRMLSGLVVAVVLGVLAYWWYNNRLAQESEIALSPETSSVDDQQPTETTEQSQPELFVPAEPAVAAATQLVQGVSYERPADLNADNPNALPAIEVPLAAVLQNNPVIQKLSDETVELDNTPATIEEAVILTQNSSAVTSTADTTPVIALANNDQASVETATEPANIATTSPASATDTLLLKTDSESWVSIIDAADNRLMYGILTSGTPRKLQGLAPFNVVLGAAPGIEATLNGSTVDFSSLIRKSNTARFVIEQTGEAHR